MRLRSYLAVGCLALFGLSVQAETLSGLYQVREPVNGQGTEARAEATQPPTAPPASATNPRRFMPLIASPTAKCLTRTVASPSSPARQYMTERQLCRQSHKR